MKSLAIIFLLIGITNAQTIYDVQPGTKGNEIKLTVSNISETNPATEVKVSLVKKSPSLNFTNETETIDLMKSSNEEQASFSFDIERNVQVGRKDTIGFMITDRNGLMMMKSFILNYTPPKEFKLEQNYPNPFNPITTIQYQLPEVGTRRAVSVQLKVYDILGSEVKTLVNEEQEAGYKEIQFNGSNIASGV